MTKRQLKGLSESTLPFFTSQSKTPATFEKTAILEDMKAHLADWAEMSEQEIAVCKEIAKLLEPLLEEEEIEEEKGKKKN